MCLLICLLLTIAARAATPIPKIIHQIWLPKRHKNAPPTLAICRAVFRQSGWQYRLWDLSDLDGLAHFKNKHYFDTFPKLWPARADILRYEILYQFGGVYLDADSVCLTDLSVDGFKFKSGDGDMGDTSKVTKPADEEDRKCFAGWETSQKDLLANGVLGCPPKSPLMTNMRERIRFRGKTADIGAVWKVTGPQFLTEHPEWLQPQMHTLFYPKHHSSEAVDWPALDYWTLHQKFCEKSIMFQLWSSSQPPQMNYDDLAKKFQLSARELDSLPPVCKRRQEL
eukprot:Platyproteum_vivax@DN6414_c0_g1_i1.p1